MLIFKVDSFKKQNTNFINNGAFFNCYIQAILTCYMDRKKWGRGDMGNNLQKFTNFCMPHMKYMIFISDAYE